MDLIIKLICLLTIFVASYSRSLPNVKCDLPKGPHLPGSILILKCTPKVFEPGPVLIEFHIPEELQKSVQVFGSSLNLTIPQFPPAHSISCRVNKLRSQVCFFNVEYANPSPDISYETDTKKNTSKTISKIEHKSSPGKSEKFVDSYHFGLTALMGVFVLVAIVLALGQMVYYSRFRK